MQAIAVARTEHVAKIRDSKNFDVVGRKKITNGVSILLGKPKGNPDAKAVPLSYKFSTSRFKTTKDVRKWLSDNDIKGVKSIEKAKPESQAGLTSGPKVKTITKKKSKPLVKKKKKKKKPILRPVDAMILNLVSEWED
jgi:hypothetical protein